jgi:hypothetical protein
LQLDESIAELTQSAKVTRAPRKDNAPTAGATVELNANELLVRGVLTLELMKAPLQD